MDAPYWRGASAPDTAPAPWLAPAGPAHPARLRRSAACVTPMRKLTPAQSAAPIEPTPLSRRIGRALVLLGTLLLASQLALLTLLGTLEPTHVTLALGAFGAWFVIRVSFGRGS